MALSSPHTLPQFIQRGRATTVDRPVYDGETLLAPTAGTYTLKNASNVAVIDAQVVTVVDSVATYAIGAAVLDAEDFGEDWLEEWVLDVPGFGTVTLQREAALVRRILYPTITDDDLQRVHPGLASWLPSDQTDYEPQRIEAFDQIQAKLIGKGNRPNLIMSSWALRTVHVYWTLHIIASYFRTADATGRWAQLATEYAERATAEWNTSLSFKYDKDEDGETDSTEAAEPVVMLSDFPEQSVDWRNRWNRGNPF